MDVYTLEFNATLIGAYGEPGVYLIVKNDCDCIAAFMTVHEAVRFMWCM